MIFLMIQSILNLFWLWVLSTEIAATTTTFQPALLKLNPEKNDHRTNVTSNEYQSKKDGLESSLSRISLSHCEDDIFTIQVGNSSVAREITDSRTFSNSTELSDTFGRLFRVISFKGIGISFAKSVLSLTACSLGIKFPVSQLFPNYDSIVYLPRIGGSVACSYPFNFKLTWSASVPLYATFHYISGLATSTNLISKKWIRRIKQPKATDSIRRVGVTCTIRYSLDSGIKTSVGPLIQYVPSKAIMDFLLPILISLPTIILTLANLVINFHDNGMLTQSKFQSRTSNSGYMFSKGDSVFFMILLHAFTSIPRRDVIQSIRGGNLYLAHPNVSNDDVVEPLLSKFDWISLNQLKQSCVECLRIPTISNQVEPNFVTSFFTYRRRGFEFWGKKMRTWASKKTIGIMYTIGWLKSHTDSSYGSGIQIDILPFSPFAHLFGRRS